MVVPGKARVEGWIEGLAQLVQDQAYTYGYKKILGIPTGIVGFLGIFGMFSGHNGIEWAAIIIFLIYPWLIIIILLLDRRLAKRNNRTKSRVLNQYTEQLTESQHSNPDLFEIVEWCEEVDIQRNGDARIFSWLTIRNGNSPIRAFWSRRNKEIYDNSKAMKLPQPDVKVHDFHVDAHGTRKEGKRLMVTQEWDKPGRQIAFIHFDREIYPKELLRLRIEWNWPRYYDDLIEGDSAPFYWTFRRKIEKLDVQINLDRRCRATSITASPISLEVRPTVSQPPRGGIHLHYKLDDPPVNQKFGFYLDIRNGED